MHPSMKWHQIVAEVARRNEPGEWPRCDDCGDNVVIGLGPARVCGSWIVNVPEEVRCDECGWVVRKGDNR